MKKYVYLWVAVNLTLVIALLSNSCTVTTRNVAKEEALHYDAGYDFTDKQSIVKALSSSLFTRPPLVSIHNRPVIIVYGVSNETGENISTSGITDDIRKELILTGKVRFVNGLQRRNITREKNYQYGKSVDPRTRIEDSRQIGAKYMLAGTLRSIEKNQSRQVRSKKKKVKYYSLNLELTDIESSLIEWADSVEVIREEAKPFIGW